MARRRRLRSAHVSCQAEVAPLAGCRRCLVVEWHGPDDLMGKEREARSIPIERSERERMEETFERHSEVTDARCVPLTLQQRWDPPGRAVLFPTNARSPGRPPALPVRRELWREVAAAPGYCRRSSGQPCGSPSSASLGAGAAR